MITLVIGGAASGKSEFAEELVLKSEARPRIYLATMELFGEEARRRVEKHRAMRAAKDFRTLERYTGLPGIEVPAGSAVLLECLGNLCANELYSPDGVGAGCAAEAILKGVARLAAQSRNLVIVSNEVCSGGRDYAGDTLRYLQLLAFLHRRLAAQADNVCEVVCGLPVYHKGGEPQ